MNNRINLEKSYLALIEFLLLSKRSLTEASEKYKLSPIQATTLLLLTYERPMHSFTKIYNCDASNITGIIDGLESKQLVGRSESTTDRRVKMIKLKTKGTMYRDAIISQLTGDKSYIINRLSDSEVLSFIEILQKITA